MQNEKYCSSETSVARDRLARAAFFIVAMVLLSFFALLGYSVWAQMPNDEDRQRLVQQHPLLPPGVSINPTSKPVIGDLGGLRVTFPSGFANNVEYDGDPGLGEKRIRPKPERTHLSGLRGLGLEVRYPELSAMPYEEMRTDKSNYTIYNTPWLGITIVASSDFGDGQLLERMTEHINRDADFQFKKVPEKFHGLDVYTSTTADITKRDRDAQGVYRNDMRDVDIYIHYDKDHKVDAFIRCNNVNHQAAPCEHDFFLAQGIRARVAVNYRRGMLKNWEKIQSGLKKLIFKYQTK